MLLGMIPDMLRILEHAKAGTLKEIAIQGLQKPFASTAPPPTRKSPLGPTTPSPRSRGHPTKNHIADGQHHRAGHRAACAQHRGRQHGSRVQNRDQVVENCSTFNRHDVGDHSRQRRDHGSVENRSSAGQLDLGSHSPPRGLSTLPPIWRQNSTSVTCLLIR